MYAYCSVENFPPCTSLLDTVHLLDLTLNLNFLIPKYSFNKWPEFLNSAYWYMQILPPYTHIRPFAFKLMSWWFTLHCSVTGYCSPSLLSILVLRVIYFIKFLWLYRVSFYDSVIIEGKPYVYSDYNTVHSKPWLSLLGSVRLLGTIQ